MRPLYSRIVTKSSSQGTTSQCLIEPTIEPSLIIQVTLLPPSNRLICLKVSIRDACSELLMATGILDELPLFTLQ